MTNDLKPVWVTALKNQGKWEFFLSDEQPGTLEYANLHGPMPRDWCCPTYDRLAEHLRSRGFIAPPIEYFTSDERGSTDDIEKRVPPESAS